MTNSSVNRSLNPSSRNLNLPGDFARRFSVVGRPWEMGPKVKDAIRKDQEDGLREKDSSESYECEHLENIGDEPEPLGDENEDPEEVFRKANCFFKEKSYPTSVHWYDKVLALDPGHTSALFNKALALIILEKYEEALSVLDEVVELDPGDVTALEILSELRESGTYSDTSVREKRTEYYTMLAERALSQKRLKDSLLFYNKALKSAEEKDSILVKRAELYFRINKYLLAKKDVEKALETNPHNEKARLLKEKVDYILKKRYPQGLPKTAFRTSPQKRKNRSCPSANPISIETKKLDAGMEICIIK